MRERLIELLGVDTCKHECCEDCEYCANREACIEYLKTSMADHLIANGVTIPVRCKDCKKRYKPNECPMCIMVYGEQHDVTHDDGYCDRGERRSDAETD